MISKRRQEKRKTINTSEHTLQHASHTPEERPTSAAQEQAYTAHRIPRGASAISARHYAGTGPAFVLMHGFPDNLHIHDRLIPSLHGREVITFDFLGWGDSEKPRDYPYTSKEQEDPRPRYAQNRTEGT